MRAIVQRVRSASVEVGGREIASIGRGFLVLLGIHHTDSEADGAWMADKIAKLRVFTDDAGKMNLAMAQVGGACLMVPNFTLCAESAKGARPSFSNAKAPADAKPMFERVCAAIQGAGVPVSTGEFGADMLVRIENDGPVTIIFDSVEMPGRAQAST